MNRLMAISTIQDYMLDLKEPKCNWKASRFSQLSYSRWAANEVLIYVTKRKNISPIIAVEEFIAKVDKYSCMNAKHSYPFSIAHDIATDILDIFLASI